MKLSFKYIQKECEKAGFYFEREGRKYFFGDNKGTEEEFSNLSDAWSVIFWEIMRK